jgi:plasmid stabilization system protein ParE
VSNYLLDPCVEDELRDIWDYIAQDNPQAATAVIEAVFDTFRILAETSHIGTTRKFLAKLSVSPWRNTFDVRR